jgi:hypothetical protein
MRNVLLILGWTFAALAVAGAVLPLVPATPFVLLAVACFVRSSPAALRWLTESRLLGPIYRDWQKHRGLRPATKRALLALAALAPAVTLATTLSLGPASIASCLSAAVACLAITLVPTVRSA